MATATKPVRSLHSDHQFFCIMAYLASATIVVGFSQTYFLKSFTAAPPLPLFVHVHAAIFTSWLALYLVQSTLVAAGRVDLHRRLGVAGAALAVLLLLVGLTTAIQAAKSGYRGIPGLLAPSPQVFLIVPLRDIFIFSLFAGLGLSFRRRPAFHKRMMLLAVVGGLMPAGVARLPGITAFPALVGLILLVFHLACPVYDFARNRRIYPSYLCGALLSSVLAAPALLNLGMNPAWLRVADWMTR
jgi:hypothetical protein